MEAGHSRRSGARQDPASIEALGPGALAEMERVSPRSRVETKMNCVKLLGQRLMLRDFDRQVAAIQIRAAVLNRFTALGMPMTVAGG